MVHVTIENGTKIDTTENHPFYVEGKGWTAAAELKSGDVLHTKDGETETVSGVEVEKLEEAVKVYNLEVEDSHTYYVSVDRVLVHNECADLGDKLDYQFGKAGGNKHNVDRTSGLVADMEKLGFIDNPENRKYFEEYYNAVLNDFTNIVAVKQQSYKIKDVVYNYTATYKESFLMGKYGGAQVTTIWEGNRLLSMIFKTGSETRYNHN